VSVIIAREGRDERESCTCSARIGSIIVCYSPPSVAASANVVVARDVTVCSSSSSPLHITHHITSRGKWGIGTVPPPPPPGQCWCTRLETLSLALARPSFLPSYPHSPHSKEMASSLLFLFLLTAGTTITDALFNAPSIPH